jgi:LPS O-antigen subunit length determinant protein (WzzB/FepE family)
MCHVGSGTRTSCEHCSRRRGNQCLICFDHGLERERLIAEKNPGYMKETLEAVSLAYDEPSEAHSALERIRDHVEDVERRVRELEQAVAMQQLAEQRVRELEEALQELAALAQRELVMRVRELEEALRDIAAMDGATWYDDPSAGFAAVARRALGQEMEG